MRRYFIIVLLPVFYSFHSCVAVTEYKAERFFNQEKYTRSIIEYNKLIADNPKPSYYFERALARIEKGDLKRAEGDLDKVIEKGFQPLKVAYMERARVRLQREKYSEAFQDFKSVTLLDSTEAFPYMEWAEGLVELKRFDAAMEKLEQANKRDSSNWEIPFKKGYIKQLEGEFQSSLEYYSIAEEMTGRNVFVYFNRGYVMKDLGEEETACENWKAGCMMSHEPNCEAFDRFCVKKERVKKGRGL